jgi:hypothetical protein
MKRLGGITLYGIVGLLSVALFLILHPIVSTHWNTRFLGGAYGDGGLYVWLAQSFYYAPHDALGFETNTFYPYPLTRAWSDSFLLPSAVISALVLSGLPFPAAYNTIILLTFALNAIGVCALSRVLRLHSLSSAIAGITFANASYLVGNLGHPQLLFFFWIPFAWSLVLPQLHVRTAARNWFFAGLCVAGAFYCGVYYAIFAVLGLATFWIAELLSGAASQRRLLRMVLLATLGAAPILYALPEYLAVQSYFGKRGLYEAAEFAASGLSYLSFSPHNDLFSAMAHLSHSEAMLSPGYIVLLSAVVSAFWLFGRSQLKALTLLCISALLLAVSSSVVDKANTSEWIVCITAWLVIVCSVNLARSLPRGTGVFVVLISLFFVFSFGPGGNPMKHEPAWTPFGTLYSLVPGLASIRAVSRFGSVVVMGVVILAARLCEHLLSSRSKAQVILASLLVGAYLAENVTSTIPFDTISARPQAFEFVASRASKSDATVVLPFSGALANNSVESWSRLALLSTEYAQWATPLGLQIVNGYSGQRSKLQLELPRALYRFPSTEAFSYLARICGVRWVVVVPRLFEEWNDAVFRTAINTFSSEIRASHWLEDGSIVVELNPLTFSSPRASEPLFAPIKRNVTLAINPQDSNACNVRVASLGRGPHGAVVPRTETISSLAAPVVISPPHSPGHPAAAPEILLITGETCTPSVQCRVQQ